MNKEWLIYLGACHANGWNVSIKGFNAFMRQIQSGLRNTDGTWRRVETND